MSVVHNYRLPARAGGLADAGPSHRFVKERALIAALSLLVLAGPIVAATDETLDRGSPADVQLRLLAPRVWLHTSYYRYPNGTRFPSNGLVVEEGDSLLLVDTAWGELLTIQLLDQIEKLVHKPVGRAVITHAHGDRIAGVNVLRSRGIEVLALPLTVRLASEWGMSLPSQGLPGLSRPGDTRPLGKLELFYPGKGHAPDNLMVWLPEQSVLFGGCAVRSKATTSLGNRAHADIGSWRAAIGRTLRRYRHASVVVPGHGDPGGSELLQHTLALLGR